jgi:hypothetical protein
MRKLLCVLALVEYERPFAATHMKTVPGLEPELFELTIAMLEAPPESPETQAVLELLDQGAIRFQDALDRLRRAKQQARAAQCGLSPA